MASGVGGHPGQPRNQEDRIDGDRPGQVVFSYGEELVELSPPQKPDKTRTPREAHARPAS